MYNLISKIAIALGFLAATAVGILGGIDAALMFPAIKLIIGLIIGSSNCFVNAVSYFYVVSRNDSNKNPTNDSQFMYKNGIKSSIFAIAAMLFIGTTFVANFVGMYIGFTVLGGKLNLDWPRATLIIPGIFFGVCSAISGLYFNIKVAHTLWNIIRQQPNSILSDSERPLLTDRNNSAIPANSYTSIFKNSLIINDQNTEEDTPLIQDKNKAFSSRSIERGPTLFSIGNNLPYLTNIIQNNMNNNKTRVRANSL